ncbi:MAG: maleylpyruvate isomerase family mycothiol-dependent enzyme [Actinomycetota bacterium]
MKARGSTHEGARPLSVTEVPELRIDLAPAAEAIDRAGRRVTELLTHVEDPHRPVRGLEWTLGDLAAHLSARTERFAAYLSGVATPQGEVAGIAAENQQDLRARRERPFGDHVDQVRSNVASFVATTRGKLGADPFPWYSAITLDVATASGLLLGELTVHGYDAARTLGHPWPIAATDARTIIRAAAALAPWYVDEDATRGGRTTFRIAARGGPVFRVRIDDGTATVEPADGDADCTIHADPAALVLLSYRRITRWQAAGRGKLVATGRRPWRALRFERSFRSP